KFSYKLKDGTWYMCDLDGNPVKPAPEDIQNKILAYLDTLPEKEKIDELPLVSVITVVLNGEKYLEQTIQSVINQTYPNVEYIIIDGGSTDGTLDTIKKYEDYIDYWLSERDEGMYDALKKGFSLAFGRIFTWLNYDDIFYSYTVEVVWEILRKNKKVKWITGLPSVIDDRSRLIKVGLPRYYFKNFIKLGLYRGDVLGFIQQEGTFFYRDIYFKSPINSSLKLAGDYALWVEFAKQGISLYGTRTILASFRVHKNNKSKMLSFYYSECEKLVGSYKIWSSIKYLLKFIKCLDVIFSKIKVIK
ncbi:MAG: glycosyltransferase family 2 protein, partial [Thermodesulfovibrio sp.]|nr:glycosyltransferase family 2 protein [Thermodesulfovibrio sp.]